MIAALEGGALGDAAQAAVQAYIRQMNLPDEGEEGAGGVWSAVSVRAASVQPWPCKALRMMGASRTSVSTLQRALVLLLKARVTCGRASGCAQPACLLHELPDGPVLLTPPRSSTRARRAEKAYRCSQGSAGAEGGKEEEGEGRRGGGVGASYPGACNAKQ